MCDITPHSTFHIMTMPLAAHDASHHSISPCSMHVSACYACSMSDVICLAVFSLISHRQKMLGCNLALGRRGPQSAQSPEDRR